LAFIPVAKQLDVPGRLVKAGGEVVFSGRYAAAEQEAGWTLTIRFDIDSAGIVAVYLIWKRPNHQPG
jgi:hypothetical protein